MMSVMNNPELVGFYALAFVAIFASLRVITHANPVHAILAMMVLLLSIAGIMFIIGAPFAGALEIVVYAGAILVLFVFVIMMLNLGTTSDKQEERWLDAKTWAVPTGLTFIIAVVLYTMIGGNQDEAAVIGGVSISAKIVGTALFSKYIVLVEIAALLLLAALVAAYHLGKKSIDNEIVSNASLDLLPSVTKSNRIIDADDDYTRDNDNDHDHDHDDNYDYKEIDPYDYVGKPMGMISGTRKELD